MSNLLFYLKSLLLFAFFRFTTPLDQVKEIDMQYRNGYLYLPIEIGTPPQWFTVLFDTTSFHLYLANTTLKSTFPQTFNPVISSSSEQTDSNVYQIIDQKGVDIKDYIGFFRQGYLSPNKKFHFILLGASNAPSTTKVTYDGVFGFARKYPGKILDFRGFKNIEANPRFSLIQYLYVNNIIDTKSMGFKFISRNQAKLTFGYFEGDYGDNIIYCDISNEEIPAHLEYFWLCKSKNIKLGSNHEIVYENSSFLILDSMNEHMRLPPSVGVSLTTHIENAFPNAKNYKVHTNNLGTYLFYKSGNDFQVNKVPDFEFTINDKLSLKITGKDLFTESSVEINGKLLHGYKSLFSFGAPDIDDIYVGLNFMKRYHIVFDKESALVGFGNYIGDDILRLFNRGFWPRRRRWQWTHIVIVILSLIIIIGLLYMYRKKQLKKKYKKGLIKKSAEKRKNQEELIEPIGKPMISVKEK